jgi:hypothetical protein
LFWALDRGGLVQQLVPPADRPRYTEQPPADTRAWTLAMLLRVADPDQVDHVNWDAIRVRIRRPDGSVRYRSVELADPLGFTKAQTERLFQSAESVEEILDRLEQMGNLPA